MTHADVFASQEAFHAHLAAIVESSHDAILSKDLQGIITSWNRGAERLYGYTAEEAIGQHVSMLVPDDHADEIPAIMARLRRGEHVEHYETVRQAKDGRRLNISLTVSPIRDKAGRVVGASAVARDINERKRAEQQLAQVKAQTQRQMRLYETINASTPDLVYVFDLNYRFIYANAALLEMWGRDWEDAIGKSLLEIGYEPWHAEMHEREIDQVVATKQPVRGEVPFPHDRLGRRIYDYIFVPILSPAGEVEAVAGTTRDVTESRQTEQALRASEQRLRFTLEAADFGYWDMDLSGPPPHTATRSLKHDQIFGYHTLLPEWNYDLFMGHVLEADRSYVDSQFQRAMGTDEDCEFECRIRRADGAIRWIWARGRMLHRGDAQPQRMLGLLQDITERKEAEEALRRSEQQRRVALEAAQMGTWDYEVASETLHWDSRTASFFGLDGKASVPLVAAFERIHADDRAEVQRQISEAIQPASDGRYDIEYRVIPDDGALRWVRAVGQTLFEGEGDNRRASRFVGVVFDTTKARAAQAALEEANQRAQRNLAQLEAVIGQMTEGVVIADPQGNIISMNDAALAQHDMDSLEQVRRHLHDFEQLLDLIDLEDGDPVPMENWPLARALRGETFIEQEVRVRNRHSDRSWVASCGGTPVRDEAGSVQLAIVTVRDITDRHRTEINSRFLSEATQTLGSSLDYETTLRAVAELAVPQLADWCVVDVLDENDQVRRLAISHVDPEKAELVREITRRYPINRQASSGVAKVLRTGEPAWAAEIPDRLLVELAQDEQHLQMLRRLGLRSFLAVPLKVHDRMLGVLTFVTAESDHRYDQHDLQLAQQLADRATLAIENARLYRNAQQEIAQRQRAEGQLQQLNETLEQRVSDRTAEAEKRAEQLQLMAKQLSEAEQQERRRLAQLLHDDLQQILVAAKMRLTGLRPADAQVTDDIEQLLAQAIDTSRSLSTELAPPVLYDVGLGAALEWLGRWAKDKYTLNVAVTVDDSVVVEDEPLRVMLFEAVRELLLNVVKHAKVDEAHLRLQYRDGRVAVAVEDYGEGFDPDDARTAATGSGYGLFSLRERLELVGGQVNIASIPGKGTCVQLTVPLASDPRAVPEVPTTPAHESTESAGPISTTQTEATRTRVLLTDDHEIVRQGLANLLNQQSDMEIVAEAASGEEAVDLAREHRPDVVVMDISLPGMSGIEATRRITDALPQTFVIGLSAHEARDVAEQLRSAGAVGFYNKSQAAEQLVEAIRGCVHRPAEASPSHSPGRS